MDLNLLFAYAIAILAGLACIGALAVVLVAEWYAIRRTIERHRRPEPRPEPRPAHQARYWLEHSALIVPERRP
jgi:O-antigen ligase